jgi:predicted metal-binding membrane protein
MIYDAQEFARVWKPVLLVSAAAWTLLLIEPSSTTSLFGSCFASSTGAAPSSLRMLLTMMSPASLGVLGWTLMLVAMMAPVLIQPVYHIRLRCFARRRGRSIASFLAGYVVIWIALGAVLVPTQVAAKSFAQEGYLLVAGAILVALIWQFSPIKQRCLNGCHAHPALAAFGTAADVDAFRFGITHGIWCAGSCWALMLLPMLLARGHLAAMAVVAVLIFSERLEPPRRPCWACRCVGKATRIVTTQVRLRLFGASSTLHSLPYMTEPTAKMD